MYFLLKTFSFLVSLLPEKFIYAISSFFTRMVFFIWRSKRKNIRENYKTILEYKFNQQPAKKFLNHIMKKNFTHYGMFSAEFLMLKKLDKKGKIHYDFAGQEHIKKGLSKGRGFVMCVLHFGNWDAAGAIISKTFAPAWAVADNLGGGYSKYVQESRGRYGIKIIIPGQNLRDIYAPLENNNILNILVDRPLPAGDKKGVEITFFGKKATVAPTAARVILKSGAAAALGYAIRKQDGFHGVCSPPVEFSPSGDTRQDLQNLTQLIFYRAEKIISAHPEQWYMFRSFWQK